MVSSDATSRWPQATERFPTFLRVMLLQIAVGRRPHSNLEFPGCKNEWKAVSSPVRVAAVEQGVSDASSFQFI